MPIPKGAKKLHAVGNVMKRKREWSRTLQVLSAAGRCFAMHESRFETWTDPADLWTIWDKLMDAPALLGGMPLIGLEENLSKLLCILLNAGAQSDEEVLSKSTTGASFKPRSGLARTPDLEVSNGITN